MNRLGHALPVSVHAGQHHVRSQAPFEPVFFASYLVWLKVFEVTRSPRNGSRIMAGSGQERGVREAVGGLIGDRSWSSPAEAPARDLRRGGFESRHPQRLAGSPA